MKWKKLQTGVINDAPSSELARGEGYLERDALLVYDGDFESMDGPVTVTKEIVERLFTHFNERREKRLAKSPANFASLPPVQVDHSNSAHDTVGRLVGPLRVQEFAIDEDGETIVLEGFAEGAEMHLGLFGPLRFIGADNCQKADNGLWHSLSIGADFDEGVIQELTVTPFPAAPFASLLSKTRASQGAKMPGKHDEKLKKHLTESEKCSEKEADEKLSKMSDDDKEQMSSKIDEDEKKLAAEKDEEQKKLAAASKANVVKLQGMLGESQKRLAGVRLAARKQEIITRLSGFRAEGKVTPAEVKKIDLDKLAAKSEESVSTFMESLSAREPVIHIGRFGSLKSIDVSKVAKSAKLSAYEAEARLSFKSNPNNRKKLAGGDGDGVPVPAPQPAAAAKVEQDQVVQVLQQAEEALSNGDTETALKYIQALRVAMAEGVEAPVPQPAQEAAMSALTKQVTELSTALTDMTKLCEAMGA